MSICEAIAIATNLAMDDRLIEEAQSRGGDRTKRKKQSRQPWKNTAAVTSRRGFGWLRNG
jgi:hypothetical protein